MSTTAEIIPFGENAFLIEWSDEISQHNHSQVNSINSVIKEKYSEFIVETTPSYQSLAIYFKKGVDVLLIIESINHILNENFTFKASKNRVVQIPVCYEEEFGLDLKQLSNLHKLPPKSIIAHHTKPIYPVYFIGFLPGFPYLEGLNPLISTPRKEKPRRVVKAGSVGIAGNQTGVYPMDSPGGWNIIGRSPISFFDAKKDSPSLLRTGDAVKFESISKFDFYQIEKAVKNNSYEPLILSDND